MTKAAATGASAMACRDKEREYRVLLNNES